MLPDRQLELLTTHLFSDASLWQAEVSCHLGRELYTCMSCVCTRQQSDRECCGGDCYKAHHHPAGAAAMATNWQ